MQNQRSLNHFNISHIAFLAKNKQKRLSLDVISRELIDLHDSHLLPTRFYSIHLQHFAQTYPASQGPQKSSRIYLCSLHSKPAFRAGFFGCLSQPRGSAPTILQQHSNQMLTKQPVPNPTFYRQVRNHPLGNYLSTSHLRICKFPTSCVVLR